MEAKLRSILKQIHWSLAIRAAIFSLAWIWLPFWLFFIVALCLYFVPFSQTGKLAVPFFTLILLSYLQSPSVAFAIVSGVVFYSILLIKGLILIDRRSAYELLVLVLVFLLLRDFYIRFNGGIGGAALIYAFFTAIVFALLLRSFIRCFRDEAVVPHAAERAAVLLSPLLFWQVLIAGLCLPVDFIYQSAAVFLVAILLVDLVPDYLFGVLSRVKVLTAATAVLALFVIILGSARWGL